MTGFKLRPKPDDFRATYIRLGKPAVIEHYRAHWKTIKRWVEEEGKDELRKARAEYVAAQRTVRVLPGTAPRVDAVKVDPDDVSAACQYLRENRNGGWRVGLRDDGSYFVGTRNLVGSEVVSLAIAKGMDEWYVENDIRKRIALGDGIDEWVLDPEGKM